MPASGGLSNIFGRRVVMLGSIAIFAAGSAINGAAQSMNMLIIGRSEHAFSPSCTEERNITNLPE